MNPQQPQSTSEPGYPVSPQQQPARKSRKKLAIGLLIAPTILIIGTILLYAVLNFIFSSTSTDNGDLFGNQSPLQSVANVILFFLGMTGVLTWLPGIIIGIVLLAKEK